MFTKCCTLARWPESVQRIRLMFALRGNEYKWFTGMMPHYDNDGTPVATILSDLTAAFTPPHASILARAHLQHGDLVGSPYVRDLVLATVQLVEPVGALA